MNSQSGDLLIWSFPYLSYPEDKVFNTDLLLCTNISPRLCQNTWTFAFARFVQLSYMILLVLWESFPFNFSLINNNHLSLIMCSSGSLTHQHVFPSLVFLHQDALSHIAQKTLLAVVCRVGKVSGLRTFLDYLMKHLHPIVKVPEVDHLATQPDSVYH